MDEGISPSLSNLPSTSFVWLDEKILWRNLSSLCWLVGALCYINIFNEEEKEMREKANPSPGMEIPWPQEVGRKKQIHILALYHIVTSRNSFFHFSLIQRNSKKINLLFYFSSIQKKKKIECPKHIQLLRLFVYRFFVPFFSP